MSGVLVLVRHGQSEGNKADRFTGWLDMDLSAQGHIEAQQVGLSIKRHGLRFDAAFTSALQRAQKTCAYILAATGSSDVVAEVDAALNERHYGDLTGLTKGQAAERWGRDQVDIWRRSYDIAPPNGESISDTALRVQPYYREAILPKLRVGETVLVVAHGNSLRPIMMDVENMSGDEVAKIETKTGGATIYRIFSEIFFVKKCL